MEGRCRFQQVVTSLQSLNNVDEDEVEDRPGDQLEDFRDEKMKEEEEANMLQEEAGHQGQQNTDAHSNGMPRLKHFVSSLREVAIMRISPVRLKLELAPRVGPAWGPASQQAAQSGAQAKAFCCFRCRLQPLCFVFQTTLVLFYHTPAATSTMTNTTSTATTTDDTHHVSSIFELTFPRRVVHVILIEPKCHSHTRTELEWIQSCSKHVRRVQGCGPCREVDRASVEFLNI